MLGKRQIENNVSWLVSHASSPVKYLTHMYLLKADPSSKAMKDLWVKVKNDRQVKSLFSKQRPDGSWGNGSYKLKTLQEGYTPFTPKYVTTVWILPILGDLGFDTNNERIRKASEYAMSYQCPDGMFYRRKIKDSIANAKGYSEPTYPCDLSIYLTALGSIGLGEDKRLAESYNQLLRMQRKDGGWVNELDKQRFNWTRSCPWVSYFGASALYYSRNPEYRSQLIKALNFLVWHLSIKEEKEIRRFFYHGHNMVKELLMFSEYEIDMSKKPIRVLLEWLLTMYHQDEGFFVYQGKPVSGFAQRQDGVSARVMKYRLYHLIETDWFTYYLSRIALNMLKH